MFEIDSAILVGTTVTIRVPYSRNDSPQIHAERPIGGAEQNGCFISILLKCYALHIYLLFFSLVFVIFKAAQRLSA